MRTIAFIYKIASEKPFGLWLIFEVSDENVMRY